ncbi:MAG: hypothetical protein ACI9Z9_001152 [Litorivivens sp.]
MPGPSARTKCQDQAPGPTDTNRQAFPMHYQSIFLHHPSPLRLINRRCHVFLDSVQPTHVPPMYHPCSPTWEQPAGRLFEGRFRSSLVQGDVYPLNCIRYIRYIEFNPVRAGMTTDPGDYRWSSYRCHTFGITAGMCTPRPEYLGPAP